MTETDQTRAVSEPELTGIDGWLILPLIHLVFSPFFLLWTIAERYPDIAERVPAHPHAAHGMFILLMLPVFAFYIFCLVRFLQKRREVPWLMTGFYGLNIISLLVTIIGRLKGYDFPDEIAARSLVAGHMIPSLVQLALSITLLFSFHNSVRVTNTFTVAGPSRDQKREPKGLGGWLILPLSVIAALLVFMLIDSVMTGLVPRMLFAFRHGHWLIFYRQTLFAALGIGGSIGCLFYAVQRKQIARWLLTTYFALWTVITALSLALEPFKRGAAISGAVFLALLAYLLLSRRVKNTFVR